MAFLAKAAQKKASTTKDEEEIAATKAEFLITKQIENTEVRIATLEAQIGGLEKNLKDLINENKENPPKKPEVSAQKKQACTSLLRKIKSQKTSLSKLYKMQMKLEDQLINIQTGSVDEDFYTAIKAANEIAQMRQDRHDANLEVMQEMKELENQHKQNQMEMDEMLNPDEDDQEELNQMMAKYEEEITAEMTQKFDEAEATMGKLPVAAHNPSLKVSAGPQVLPSQLK